MSEGGGYARERGRYEERLYYVCVTTCAFYGVSPARLEARVGAQLDWALGLTHIRQVGLVLIRQVETVGPQDLNLLFRLHVVPSTGLSV